MGRKVISIFLFPPPLSSGSCEMLIHPGLSLLWNQCPGTLPALLGRVSSSWRVAPSGLWVGSGQGPTWQRDIRAASGRYEASVPAQAGHSAHTWLALEHVAACVWWQPTCAGRREEGTAAGCVGLSCCVLFCALLCLLTCESQRLWVNSGLGGISLTWNIMCVCDTCM